MSVLHVLRDIALERGLGQLPTSDLALWAASKTGELGALGREALASSTQSLPHRPWLGSSTGSRCRSRSIQWHWMGSYAQAQSASQPWTPGSRVGTDDDDAWSRSASGSQIQEMPWSTKSEEP